LVIRVAVPLPTVMEPSLTAIEVPPMLRLRMPAASSPAMITPVAVLMLSVRPSPPTEKLVWKMPALGFWMLFCGIDVPSPTMIVPELTAVESPARGTMNIPAAPSASSIRPSFTTVVS